MIPPCATSMRNSRSAICRQEQNSGSFIAPQRRDHTPPAQAHTLCRTTRSCCAVDLSETRCHIGTMPAVIEKKSRLVARIPSAVRKTIQAAADLEGATLNHFVVQAAHRQAQEILERETIIRLNREQTKRVFDLLDKPPKPNAALIAAKAAHRKLVRA